MEELRDRFIEDFTEYMNAVRADRHSSNKLVVATMLPSGAVEIQINTEDLVNKMSYIAEKYDDDFRLKTNPSIQIVGYMLV